MQKSSLTPSFPFFRLSLTPFFRLVRLAVIVFASTILIPVAATGEGLSALLDCGFDGNDQLVVDRVDAVANAFVRGVRTGDDCVNAYAELRGRLKALELGGAETNVAGPTFARLSTSSPSCRCFDCVPVCACGTFGSCGCDIWDFSSNTVSRDTPPTRPVVVAFLVCGQERNGSLGVRFLKIATAGVVLDAEQNSLVQDLQSETSCAQARARLITGFAKLGARSGASPIVRGPEPGVKLSKAGEETLTFTYEITW